MEEDNSLFSVKGKTCLITGGTSGIGLAAARRFSAAGAQVIITGRRDEGRVIAEDIGACFLQLDVTDENALRDALAGVQRDFDTLDVVINNAGSENTGPTIAEADVAAMRALFEINVMAAYNVLHYCDPLLAGGASIVNTSSVAAGTGMPGYAQYAASKSAINSLTRAAALELAPRGIRVNAVAPGSIATEMLPRDHPEVAVVRVVCPLERIGAAEEVAALLHFLACDESRYITGAVIPIDGGISAGLGYPLLQAVAAAAEEQ